MRLNWYKISPEGFQVMKGLENFVEKSKLEPKLKELINIRASQLNGCGYCVDRHTKDALAIGEDEQRINLLTVWRDAPIYSEREMAALAWCESLTLLKETGAPDSAYTGLERVFSPEEIVELTIAVVTINSWSRLSVGFRSEIGHYISNKQLTQDPGFRL
jgi:AhpD family alkylhydroperoxidase